jgi:hypothetical protein
MNTVLTGTTRSVGARATLLIVAAVMLGIAALAVWQTAADVTGANAPAWLGDYLTEVGEAMARE